MESPKVRLKDMSSDQKCARLFVVTWTFLYWTTAILGVLFSFIVSTACKALPYSQWVPCIAVLSCIPLSMIITIYKMKSSYRKGKYLQIYLYWTLPLLVSIPAIIYNSIG